MNAKAIDRVILLKLPLRRTKDFGKTKKELKAREEFLQSLETRLTLEEKTYITLVPFYNWFYALEKCGDFSVETNIASSLHESEKVYQ
ncbi:hypothetical protein AALP_AA4G023600 [Arabis alpina]|uniref:Uncharacterized protein n=1 Tax=Arabis alpina TaxID=50452 RepID=A0A087H0N1_ARAAL|nr:hypothetical protein AALP_AA4G023600 [Arabis alpina]